jgi:uncharacterized protein (DUF924 family)
METYETIREFWFGPNTDDKAVVEDRSRLWWSKNPATDKDMRQRFETMMTKAANHELDSWAATPGGCLALILLTDQFPRNIYRNTPRCFSFDPLARSWCKDGIQHGSHKRLRPIERVFFYLPLEHSESLEDQNQSVALYEELASGRNSEHGPKFDGFLRFAIRHRDIIKRFNRFPHRNQILGRESSPEELAFLKEKRSSF